MIIAVTQDDQSSSGQHIVFKTKIDWAFVLMMFCFLGLAIACLTSAEPRERGLLLSKIFFAITIVLLPWAGSIWTVRFDKDRRQMEVTHRIFSWSFTRRSYSYDDLSLEVYLFKYSTVANKNGSMLFTSKPRIAVKAGTDYYQLIMAPRLYMSVESLPLVRHFLGFPVATT